MKHIFILILSSFFVFPQSYGQELQPKGIMQVALASDFNAYFQALEEQDFDLALDFVYPMLFDLIPREFLQETLEEESSDGMNIIKLTAGKIQHVSNIIEDEHYFYTLVSFTYFMEIQEGDSDNWDEMEEDEGDWGSEGMNVDDFRRKFGVQNVFYDATKKIIRVKRTGKMIAIQSKDEFEDDGWKFIELKEDMNQMVNQLIPSGILSKLKS